jgi:hypothetical protein
MIYFQCSSSEASVFDGECTTEEEENFGLHEENNYLDDKDPLDGSQLRDAVEDEVESVKSFVKGNDSSDSESDSDDLDTIFRNNTVSVPTKHGPLSDKDLEFDEVVNNSVNTLVVSTPTINTPVVNTPTVNTSVVNSVSINTFNAPSIVVGEKATAKSEEQKRKRIEKKAAKDLLAPSTSLDLKASLTAEKKLRKPRDSTLDVQYIKASLRIGGYKFSEDPLPDHGLTEGDVRQLLEQAGRTFSVMLTTSMVTQLCDALHFEQKLMEFLLLQKYYQRVDADHSVDVEWMKIINDLGKRVKIQLKLEYKVILQKMNSNSTLVFTELLARADEALQAVLLLQLEVDKKANKDAHDVSIRTVLGKFSNIMNSTISKILRQWNKADECAEQIGVVSKRQKCAEFSLHMFARAGDKRITSTQNLPDDLPLSVTLLIELIRKTNTQSGEHYMNIMGTVLKRKTPAEKFPMEDTALAAILERSDSGAGGANGSSAGGANGSSAGGANGSSAGGANGSSAGGANGSSAEGDSLNNTIPAVLLAPVSAFSSAVSALEAFVALILKDLLVGDESMKILVLVQRWTVRDPECYIFLLFLLSVKEGDICSAVKEFRASPFFKVLQCKYFVPFDKLKDPQNTAANGYCWYISTLQLMWRFESGYFLTVEELRLRDKLLYVPENKSDRVSLFNHMRSVKDILTYPTSCVVSEKIHKEALAGAVYCFKNMPKVFLDKTFWGRLHWCAYLPFNCSAFAEPSPEEKKTYAGRGLQVGEKWLELQVSSLVHSRVPFNDLGSACSLADIDKITTTEANYLGFVNDHFFPFDCPGVEATKDSFAKCCEDILVKVLERVSGVTNKVAFTTVIKLLRDNSVDEVCDGDVQVIRGEIDRMKDFLSLKSVPRLEERPLKKAVPPVNKTSEEKDLMIYELKAMVTVLLLCHLNIIF